jgi:hypothetical protein
MSLTPSPATAAAVAVSPMLFGGDVASIGTMLEDISAVGEIGEVTPGVLTLPDDDVVHLIDVSEGP